MNALEQNRAIARGIFGINRDCQVNPHAQPGCIYRKTRGPPARCRARVASSRHIQRPRVLQDVTTAYPVGALLHTLPLDQVNRSSHNLDQFLFRADQVRQPPTGVRTAIIHDLDRDALVHMQRNRRHLK